MSKQKLAHVVMGNDFPSSVYTTNQAAEACCHRNRVKELEKRAKEGGWGPLVYWRVYSFPLLTGKETPK